MAKIALVIQIEQFAAFIVIEKEAFGVEQLQRVVFRRIVRGGDGDAAASANGGDINLNRRRGSDADVDHFAARGEQSAGNRVLQHRSAGAGVPAHHHASAPDISAEGLGEGAGQRRREEFTHHAANAGNADLEQMLPQAKLLTCSSSVSNRRRGGSPRCSQITRTIGSVWLTRTWNQ